MKRYTVRPRLTTARAIRVGGGAEESDFVTIGRLAEAGQVVRVNFDLSEQHVVAIVGKRGSGKSYTLGTFLEGICAQEPVSAIGRYSGATAGLLFDTLGIFQWADILLSSDSPQDVVREQFMVRRGWDIDTVPLDVRIWVPRSSSGGAEDSQHDQFVVKSSDFTASDWGYLLDLDILQDRMGQLLNDAYIKVTLEGWLDGETTRPARPEYDIDDLITCVRGDPELRQNYQNETRRAVIQQLATYARNPLFGGMGTDLAELLRPGVLSVIVMNRLSDELRFAVISALIRRIMRARIEASELEKDVAIRGNGRRQQGAGMEPSHSAIPPCWIAADEAQNFLPTERRTTASDVLVRLVREGRNYGLSFVLTTQQPTAIDARILAQVDTLVTHKLTVQSDIEYVRRNIKSGLPDEIRYANSELKFDELLRALDVGQALVSNTDSDRAFIIDVRPRISVHGGF